MLEDDKKWEFFSKKIYFKKFRWTRRKVFWQSFRKIFRQKAQKNCCLLTRSDDRNIIFFHKTFFFKMILRARTMQFQQLRQKFTDEKSKKFPSMSEDGKKIIGCQKNFPWKVPMGSRSQFWQTWREFLHKRRKSSPQFTKKIRKQFFFFKNKMFFSNLFYGHLEWSSKIPVKNCSTGC